MRAGLSLSKIKPASHNRRLWLLVGLGCSLLAGELAMRAWEMQMQMDRELKSLRGRIELLQASADPMDWAALSKQISQLQAALHEQLWHAPSEAQAQAMFRDWLSNTLKTAGIQRPSLRLQPPQPARQPRITDPADAAAPAASSPGVNEQLLQQAIRVRAQLSFELQPGALETVLQSVERGGQLANVDNLAVSKRTRRVEMEVSMPVIIKAAPGNDKP